MAVTVEQVFDSRCEVYSLTGPEESVTGGSAHGEKETAAAGAGCRGGR